MTLATLETSQRYEGVRAFHDRLRGSPDLSDAAVRLALILSGYASRDGTCFPSQRRLSRDLDWSLSKVKRTVKELTEKEIIRYRERARCCGERSSIQLVTGVTSDTGFIDDTGTRTEPVSNLNGTGVKSDTSTGVMDDTQNSSNELTQELLYGKGRSNGKSKSPKPIPARSDGTKF